MPLAMVTVKRGLFYEVDLTNIAKRILPEAISEALTQHLD